MIELLELMEEYQDETSKLMSKNNKRIKYSRFYRGISYKGKEVVTQDLCPFYSDTIKKLLN